MAYLKAFFRLFSFFGKIAPLAKFAGWLSWIPGAQIVGVIGAIFGAIISLFKWLIVDITDAFKEPQRLVVRTICVLVALGAGVYFGIKHDAHKVEAQKQITNKLISDVRKADEASQARAAKAVEARKAAEDAERAKAVAQPVVDPVAPQPATTPPRRVRKAGSGSSGDGAWMPSVFALPGGSK